jgi:tetratricopeptide (TPR) repeat protein
MLYVTLGLMYFWAAVAKSDVSWLDGTTMRQIMSSRTSAMAIMTELGGAFGLDLRQCLIIASWGSMLTEYFLAAAVLWKRLRWIAFWLAPAFHFSIELMQLQIEWFSYYMVTLTFVMFLPDPIMQALARGATRATAPIRRRLSPLRQPHEIVASTRLGLALLAITAALLAVALLIDFPLEGRPYLWLGVGLAVLLAQLPRAGQTLVGPIARAGLQVALAGAMMWPLTRMDVGFDFFRFWGGDLRRRGQLEAAAGAYDKANALEPESEARYVQLAEVLEQLGRFDAALQAYEMGLRRREEARERALAAIEAARGDDAALARARKAAARAERRRVQTERARKELRQRIR